MVPTLPVAASTPQRTTSTSTTTQGNGNGDVALRTPSNSSGPPSYRLLYRGALSLPDSYLLLDGLTFSARLESPIKYQLLENPLALALESMRGRQTLRFLGTVKLNDVWLDESANVEMMILTDRRRDIHPQAVISRAYFENIFCLLPYPPASTSHQATDASPGTRSELGVKIALGDTDGPETTHIIVFGQVISPHAHAIRLRVARMTSHPPPKPTPVRILRPDDPIPRRPPIILNRTNSLGARGLSRDLKRTASSSSGTLALSLVPGEGGVVPKKQKLTNGSAKVSTKAGSDITDKVFKVPLLPGKTKGKGKEREKEDVFGSVLKRKGSFGDGLEKGKEAEETEVERTNKNLIKKAALEYLCKTKDPTLQRTVDRTHPEFKEIWGWIYRGVGFALRAHMKITPLDGTHIQPLIETHARMYIGGPLDGIETVDRS
ncbi:hypothetical protein P691DRAFT_674201 [Macrolepiota fuliginosa MF-IS2]|uniref:Sld7 C-terminal domain-containing protein n=1 Tax=Macrolepiota fuliginosa MF-IS2 TaxID=1400762 RepID=A0A9P6C234_9AGAR|nr:hypothetical protein P691DRAFT_674201 [Macrolepiota fuliginosa MF-IS2]